MDFRRFGVRLGPSEKRLGDILKVLAAPWAVLSPSLTVCDVSWNHLENLFGRLGAS